MEWSLAGVALPSRRAAILGLRTGLAVCALGLAVSGFVAAGGVPAWSSMLLMGSSLVAAAAAGFVRQPAREAVEPHDVLEPHDVIELLGASGDGVWDYDLRSARIVYNRACATMLGYTADEITSTLSHWGTLVHPDDLPRARRALDDYLEGPAPHYRVQIRMRRKDGGWAHVLDCGQIVARDERGRPRRACGIHRLVPGSTDGRDVASVVSSDLDQALAGLLGQATLTSSPGEGAELERAAWRCVALVSRLKRARDEASETPTETDVVAVARSIAEDAEQWTPKRVLLRVHHPEAMGTHVLRKGVFQSLLQLAVDDAIERTGLEGGTIDVRLAREPNLVLRISTTPASPARAEETKRLQALRGLADRYGVEVSVADGALRLAWPL